ncbi:unnamed protein product [Ambrosiozyma monospora]|uniref:Unnamed protein product n=1 Tax=Ambrosiozyma monospora TaxID=43982 RepID=A0A9W7DJK0_AMBMO|nr:unnamed protein product [Ambrosiozyma monospora]
MMGDPEKDEVLLDKDKFIAKEELITILTDMVADIPCEVKNTHSFLGKSTSIEVKGTDLFDYVNKKYSDTFADLTQFVNDLIDMNLLLPKNVKTFQISTRSRYQWTDTTLIVTGKQPLPSKNKKGTISTSLFGSSSSEPEEDSVEKYKRLKDQVEDATNKYEQSISIYDEALLSFEVTMFDTLLKLELTFKNLQLSIRDLCVRFETFIDQNPETVAALQEIDAGGESDFAILLSVSNLNSKFIEGTEIFEPYQKESTLRTAFGVDLISIHDLYPEDRGASIIVSTILKEIASLSTEDKLITWKKNLDSLDDFKDILTIRTKINELMKENVESSAEFVERLDLILNSLKHENLGLILRRYLLELPESLIDTSTITILNDAFKESFDIDLDYVKSFYDVERAENQAERVNKSTLNAIVKSIYNLRAELKTDEEKQDLVNSVGLNLIHFILKPEPSTPYFLEDKYCTVLMNKIIESMDKK